VATNTVNILLVCTGNVCRSPAAEFLLAQRLGPAAAAFSVRSAGTKAVAGAPIDPRMGARLRRRGIDTAHFTSSPLDVAMLEWADLILTASTNNRADVIRLRPSTVGKTLSLRQLARYAPFILQSGQGPAEIADRIPWILSTVPMARAQAPKEDDSIADPRGKSLRRYATALDEVDRACASIAPLLSPTAAAPGVAPTASRSWWSETWGLEDETENAG